METRKFIVDVISVIIFLWAGQISKHFLGFEGTVILALALILTKVTLNP